MSELYKPPLTLRHIEGQPPRPASDELTEMAEVYADAFAGPPWNEYTKCPSDNAAPIYFTDPIILDYSSF